MKRDLLRVVDLTRDECSAIFALATEIKTALRAGKPRPLLAGKTLAMIFEKPSLRTRVSFETGMFQLGGHAIYLAPWDIRLGERETVADVARNLARCVDMIVARTFKHDGARRARARTRRVPVINGLSDLHHPCQVLADLFTLRRAPAASSTSIKVAFIGDGNNLVHSWMEAATLLPLRLRARLPARLRARRRDPRRAAGSPAPAIEVTHVVARRRRAAPTWSTPTSGRAWARRTKPSSGAATSPATRSTTTRCAHAAKDALVMHCLPAHRGEEITDDVIEGRQSIVFDQAENRLHLQKALMAWLAPGERRNDARSIPRRSCSPTPAGSTRRSSCAG